MTIDLVALSRSVKSSQRNPLAYCEAIGIDIRRGAMVRQAGGIIVRCPAHEDRTPSCSVQERGDRLLFKCHGCGWGGDIFDAYAVKNGLSTRHHFREIFVGVVAACRLHHIGYELAARAPITSSEVTRSDDERDERTYPQRHEVKALWEACDLPSSDADASMMLRGRGFDLDRVDGSDVARVLPKTAKSPRWARFRGRSWTESGHRLLFAAYDFNGELRSVRAWRVTDNDTPKRLPPAGHRAGGLVLACPLAVAMLRGTWRPTRLLVLEGEPDFLAWSCATGIAAHARIGITSGSWTDEIAGRVPTGAEVIVRTHADSAGDRYAEEIASSLAARCNVLRARSEAS